MKIQTIKDFFAPSAWRLGGAVRRAALTLLMMVLTTMMAWAESETVDTYFVDADGTRHDNITATPLTGGGSTTLAAGWYVVNSDISYTGTITLGGDVNIILCDGKTMTVSEDDNTIYGESKALHIYGQS